MIRETARNGAGVSEKNGKMVFGREIRIKRRLEAGGTRLRRRFVGARRDEVVGLTAVEAEPFVSTAILFLGSERAAAERIDFLWYDVWVVRVKRSRDAGVNEVV